MTWLRGCSAFTTCCCVARSASNSGAALPSGRACRKGTNFSFCSVSCPSSPKNQFTLLYYCITILDNSLCHDCISGLCSYYTYLQGQLARIDKASEHWQAAFATHGPNMQGWQGWRATCSMTSASGGVCVRHCSTLFRKHVLPRFCRPAPCAATPATPLEQHYDGNDTSADQPWMQRASGMCQLWCLQLELRLTT